MVVDPAGGPGESAALGFGWEVQGVTDRAEYLRSAGEMLLRLVPADVVGWNAVDLTSGVEVLLAPGDDWDLPTITAGLAEVAQEHPMMRSYLAEPRDTGAAPRRLTDIATRRELLANRAYVDFLRPMGGEHQLTVMTSRPRPDSVRGWALNRAGGSDFTERDLEVAAALQGMLALLDRTIAGLPAPPDPAAGERLGMTAREVEVLGHVAAGLTADAVGRLLRISPRTVRKHLENAYRKLGCHDRLVAVERARALGLVPRRPGRGPARDTGLSAPPSTR